MGWSRYFPQWPTPGWGGGGRGGMSELGLESTVCILLGSFMSSEQHYLVCICNTEGPQEELQRGFLKDTTWRLVSPESTYEMTEQCDRREIGRGPLGGESGHHARSGIIYTTYHLCCRSKHWTAPPQGHLKMMNPD